MVCVAMNSEHLFGPYFFDGSVNHLNYSAVLENLFIPQLQSLGIESNVWFRKDGAPAHSAITVRDNPNGSFFPAVGLTVGLPLCQFHLTGHFKILT